MLRLTTPRIAARPRRYIVPATAIGLLLALLGSDARGVTWRFTWIVDSETGSFSNFMDAPGLNRWGTAVFLGQKTDGTIGIYRGSGGAVSTVAEMGTTYAGLRRHPYINGSNTVVFAATLANGSTNGIFTRTGNDPVVPVATTGAVDFVQLDEEPSINDAGVVAFQGSRIIGGGEMGIYTKLGNDVTTIVNNQPAYGMTDLMAAPHPSINNSGVVAFSMQDFNFNTVRTLTGSGGPATLTTIALAGLTEDFLSLHNEQWINDAGVVVFRARGESGFDGIYTGSGGPAALVASTASGNFQNPNNPSIGGATVAFNAFIGFNSAILTSPNPATDKVIAAGDTLFGEQLISVVAYHGTNAIGQIGFVYTTKDAQNNFTSGIAVATPISDLLGDVDLDNAVTVLDIVATVNAFNTAPGAIGWDGRADFDDDGQITVLDVIIVIDSFGSVLAPSLE